MQKKQSQQIELVPEPIFNKIAAQCFLMFQRYRLKTHIIGSNIERDIIQQCYDSLQGRITERYTKIFEHLKREIDNLQKNFIMAKASNLRSLNNILRDYRRRVGTIANQPLSHFKYNKYDKYQKILLQSLIYNDRENYQQILQFRQELAISMEQGDKQIAEKYRSNQKIKQSYKKMLEVVDKTQCDCYKYYENFERSMITTVNNLESYFQKLNIFLTIWENVGSTKAYQTKSQKQKQMEQKTQEDSYGRRFYQEESQQHLQQFYNNSSQKQDYCRKLNDLRLYNMQKYKKMDMIGKMFNKRKNRAGILVSRYRDLNILDWYFNIEGNRTGIKYLDQFKNYTADIQNTVNQFRPTGYELQKPFKKDRIDEIKQHMLRQQKSQLNHEWRYDKFGKDGAFDLIDSASQLVQKRIEFQITRQLQLQNSDDRRKRQLFEKQNLHTRQIERKEGLHIGFLHFQENQEMQWLQNRQYHIQYLPQMYENYSQNSLQFSDQQNELKNYTKPFKAQKQNKRQQLQKQEVHFEYKQSQKSIQIIPLIRLGNQKKQKQVLAENKTEQIQQQQEHKSSDQKQFDQMDIQQQIITSFFKQYSLKVLRKESQPAYKKTRFLYYQTIEQIKWQKVSKYFECEKILISSKNTIIYLNHIFSTHQKIKGSIYTLNQQIQEQIVKKKISECFSNLALVTTKLYPIYTELQKETVNCFMLGLLLILLKQGEMPEDYQIKHYIYAGKQIIEDYNCYYFPQQYKTSHGIYMRHQNNHSYQDIRRRRQNNNVSTSDAITYEGTNSVSSKNDTTVHSLSYAQPKTMKIQEKDQFFQKKNEQVQPSYQQSLQQNSYQSYRQQIPVKRQNSRENIPNFQIQNKINQNEYIYDQNEGSEQQNYESL